MRIWDLPPSILCRNHLLGEHRELHAIWSILSEKKKGYMKHPETLRWVGKLNALYKRHGRQVIEMEKRGYKHNSPLDEQLANDSSTQDVYINTLFEQNNILRDKKCSCLVK